MTAPRTLPMIALGAFLVPAAIALLSLGAIAVIPDCDPGPYAMDGCSVGGYSLAAPLVSGLLGGAFVAFLAFALITLPSSIRAAVAAWSRR
jgi:hypothetical protein